MARGRCFSRVRDGVYEYTPVVCVCMCVIGVSTCACVPQLCRQSLGTLQLGSAACSQHARGPGRAAEVVGELRST